MLALDQDTQEAAETKKSIEAKLAAEKDDQDRLVKQVEEAEAKLSAVEKESKVPPSSCKIDD